eukprot:2706190-Karenia_brevis.AAC.1
MTMMTMMTMTMMMMTMMMMVTMVTMMVVVVCQQGAVAEEPCRDVCGQCYQRGPNMGPFSGCIIVMD